jgi:hypothetical protein
MNSTKAVFCLGKRYIVRVILSTRQNRRCAMKRKIIIQVMIVVVSMCYVIGYSIAAETRNEVSMKSHKTIKIKEKEGIIPRKVIDAADNPVYFFVGRGSTYETHSICTGCTASLRFQKKGSFRYRVKESRTYHGGEKEFRGAMLIK